jgi:hypothetical protein
VLTQHTLRAGADRPARGARAAPSARTVCAVDLTGLSTAQRVSGISILVVALAAFLPWISFLGVAIFGIHGDGVLTLALAVAGAISLATRTGWLHVVAVPERVGLVASMVFAGLVTLIGLVDLNGAAAIGLFLTLFGGIAWLVGAVWEYRAAGTPRGPGTGPGTGS